MFETLLQSSYFALFLIIALGFMLGRIQIKGLSLDVSAVIFIALLFGHFGVIIPKELGNMGLVLFIFTIGIQAGPGFFDSFRSKDTHYPDVINCRFGMLDRNLIQVYLGYRYPEYRRSDRRGIDEYARFGGSDRLHAIIRSIHRLWHRLSVRRNRRDPFRETIAQNASQGFDSRG